MTIEYVIRQPNYAPTKGSFIGTMDVEGFGFCYNRTLDTASRFPSLAAGADAIARRNTKWGEGVFAILPVRVTTTPATVKQATVKTPVPATTEYVLFDPKDDMHIRDRDVTGGWFTWTKAIGLAERFPTAQAAADVLARRAADLSKSQHSLVIKPIHTPARFIEKTTEIQVPGTTTVELL